MFRTYRFACDSLIILTGLLLLLGTASVLKAQGNRYEEIRQGNQRDWQLMLDSLNISLPDSLPPAARDPNRPAITFRSQDSGNWTDSAGNFYTRGPWGDWTNYDESKAGPDASLPRSLVFRNGDAVTGAAQWRNRRRPQIEQAFSDEIFGVMPEDMPAVSWDVVASSDTTVGAYQAVKKELVGHVDNTFYPALSVDIQLTLITPTDTDEAVPVIMHFGYQMPPGFNPSSNSDRPSWKEQVLAQGWGYAIYMPQSVQADNGAGLTEGIIGLMNKGEPRNPHDWGALRAWGWGASRALDYLESNPDTDGSRVGIEGLSRLGKAVLVTMAYDERFAIVLVGSSGKGGATLYRRKFGESLENLSGTGTYHWFSGAFIRYASEKSADDLTVDSHELIALCAPRPVFISVGSPRAEGRWVDAKGQFMAAAQAGDVYELLGARGLGTRAMPEMGTALTSGDIAFRQHFGGHTVVPNWPFFVNYAKRYFEQ